MSLDSYFFCTFAADMKKGILKNQEKGLSKSAPKSVTTARSVVTDAEFVQQAILSRLSALETKVKDLSSDNSRKERHILKGAEAFDVLHSLMNTAKKNGQSAFNVIRTIAYPKAMVDDAFLTL